MKVTWLTQAGLLFENGNATVMVDPYLSDALGKADESKKRRIPVDESFFDKQPDVLLITHAHADHLDPETLDRIFANAKKAMTVIAPENAWYELRKYGGRHNYVMLNPHSVWSERGLTFYAVKAEHSDRTAVGFIIDDGSHTYYISGDTLYNYEVIDDVEELVEDGVDYAFLPINGKGNNMNATDAADFAYEIGARKAVPLHYGLFDSIDPTSFDFDSAEVLQPYKPYEL